MKLSQYIMENICSVEHCTGCMACYNICHHAAIDMIPTELGDKYPVINNAKCIDCGLCKMTCPENVQLNYYYPIHCYAGITLDKKDLMRSSSGGIASLLSEYVIEHNGIVYGCTGDDIFNVHHIRITSKSEIEKLRGSKYVQSYIGYI